MMRYIGIDLHTNSFTVCILEEGKVERISTYCVQGADCERFISTLEATDEVALEATGNSAFFRDKLLPYVKKVVVIAPWQFEVIRRSVKKTDKHDARAIAFFLSKDMLPEARCREEKHVQISSCIQTRDQLIKLRVSLINKAHGLLNRHGLKVKKETLTTKAGFEREIGKHQWAPLELAEINVIRTQLEAIKTSTKLLEKEITAFARELPGYENLISIKGIGPLSAAILLSTIGDIDDFSETGKLAAYLGIVPRVSQSNDQQRVGKITKHGSKIARSTLVQCTLIAKRYSLYLNNFYNHIKQTRGAGKAIIATARKFLNTIFYTLKKKWIFEDFTQFKIQPTDKDSARYSAITGCALPESLSPNQLLA